MDGEAEPKDSFLTASVCLGITTRPNVLCKVTVVVDSFVGDDESESFRGVNGAIPSEFAVLHIGTSAICADGTSSLEGEKGSKIGTSGFLGETTLPNVLGKDPNGAVL